MLANGDEYPCKFRRVTIGRGEIITPIVGNPSQTIIGHLDRVGVIVGVIDSIISREVSVVFNISQVRHSRILARLEWHAARELEHIELRKGACIFPTHRNVTIKTSDGCDLSEEIIEISFSGSSVSLATRKRPSVGQAMRVGRRNAGVVRLSNDGIAVHFEFAFKAGQFSPSIII